MKADRSPLIEGRDVGRRHPAADSWLVEGVSFALRPGERLAIVGASGSGKTVLLRAVAMLDPLDRGQLLWQGQAVRCGEVPPYRSQVLYVHQRPALLEGTVQESLEVPFALKTHRARKFDRGRVVGLLEALGRDGDFLEKRVRELSGGEQQIVALIRAVQLDPLVMLLDEPTASLDPQAARAVEELVGRWLSEGEDRRAMIWVSHDESQVGRMTQRVLRMAGGKMESAEDHRGQG